jgi:hypothetical protein
MGQPRADPPTTGMKIKELEASRKGGLCSLELLWRNFP